MPAGVPNVFVNGQTPIDAGQVNANFNAITAYINGLSIPTTPVSVPNGGTGSASLSGALTNLGLGTGTLIPCIYVSFSGSSPLAITVHGGPNSPVVSSYQIGTTYIFVAPQSATGPFTFQDVTSSTSGLAAVALLNNPGANATAVASLAAGQLCVVSYDPSTGTFVLLNSPPPINTSGVPSGMIMWWTTTTPPSNWLVCNGQAVSRATYAELNAIASGFSYGAPYGAGDGSTTFNLPNLTNGAQFIRSYDGATSGTFGGVQGANLGAHNHTVSGVPTSAASSGAAFAGSGTGYLSGTATTSTSGTGADNRPTNMALLPCIKT